MEFDITHLDKKLLIQTLFAHSAPIGLGEAQYKVLKLRGDNVDGLTDEECELMLLEFNHSEGGYAHVADYCKGKPMKLDFYKKKNGRVVADSDGYDSRNGKYRFLEALLNIFFIDEVLITKKGYRPYIFEGIGLEMTRSDEDTKKIKEIIKNTVRQEEGDVKYWRIDTNKVEYKSPFNMV